METNNSIVGGNFDKVSKFDYLHQFFSVRSNMKSKQIYLRTNFIIVAVTRRLKDSQRDRGDLCSQVGAAASLIDSTKIEGDRKLQIVVISNFYLQV